MLDKDPSLQALNKRLRRRAVLQAAISAGLVLPFTDFAHAANKPPEKMRPQVGDIIVHRFGDKKGQPIKPEEVQSDNYLGAIPMDPNSQIMRDRSRFNGLNLIRVDPDQITAETREYAADGTIMAYSTICTHQGCDLTQWLSEEQTFKCYCHYSQFKATELGQPIHGPAQRKLALLPLNVENGILVAASKFVGKVGFKRK